MTMKTDKPETATPEQLAAREIREKKWELVVLPLPNGHTRIMFRKRQPEQK
jgi:hypothetical protein